MSNKCEHRSEYSTNFVSWKFRGKNYVTPFLPVKKRERERERTVAALIGTGLLGKSNLNKGKLKQTRWWPI